MTLPLDRLGVNAFRLFGYAGLAAAAAVALALTVARDASPATELAVIAAGLVTFLVLARVERALVHFHHQLAVLAVTAGLTAALGAPVLVHLEATALGLGAFLACGRIGCLHAGCCHGRVATRGVVYGPAHAAAGFPSYLAGRALVPVQAVEAAGVLGLVVLGAALVVAGVPAGVGFALYVGGYAGLRFASELMRGDPGRRWWHGLSEAQWTALGVAIALGVAGLAGALPGPRLVYLIPLMALLPAAALQAAGAIARPCGALDPRFIRELSGALRAAERPVPRPAVVSTSLGLRVSYGTDGGCDHWSLSGASPATARALAAAVLWLRRPGAEAELIPGPEGLLHIVVPR